MTHSGERREHPKGALSGSARREARRAATIPYSEVFNLTDTTNYDVQSIVTGEFLSGPTAANPALPAVRNPRFGQFNATLLAREYQLGVRWVF